VMMTTMMDMAPHDPVFLILWLVICKDCENVNKLTKSFQLTKVAIDSAQQGFTVFDCAALGHALFV
jgi:hypothetical protein